jgi:arginyl-tRNA synthetase
MNVFKDFENRIKQAVQALDAVQEKGGEVSFERLAVEPPRDPAHGDISTNAAMVLAKPLGMNPRALADMIAAQFADDADVAETAVAGPGFLNFRLTAAFWRRLAATIIREGTDYGRSTLGADRKVNVEYVSANPTGPMHVGHCRGAVVGDALANLMAFAGYQVTKEYYINDAGSQIDVLAKSVYLRYREALGEEIGEIPAGLYPGDYLVPVGQSLPMNSAPRSGRCRKPSAWR